MREKEREDNEKRKREENYIVHIINDIYMYSSSPVYWHI